MWPAFPGTINLLDLNALWVALIAAVAGAVITVAWPDIQSRYRKRRFTKLVFRELEEFRPLEDCNFMPKDKKWFHFTPDKGFVHKDIIDNPAESSEVVFSIEPDIVYDLKQMWHQVNKAKRDNADSNDGMWFWIYWKMMVEHANKYYKHRRRDWLKFWDRPSIAKKDKGKKQLNEITEQWREIMKKYHPITYEKCEAKAY